MPTFYSKPALVNYRWEREPATMITAIRVKAVVMDEETAHVKIYEKVERVSDRLMFSYKKYHPTGKINQYITHIINQVLDEIEKDKENG